MMSERPGDARKIRSIAYLLLALLAAVITPSTDVITMLLLFLAAVALFELGFFAYRRC
jgi:Sec-independent protein secretion pathway component TatC